MDVRVGALFEHHRLRELPPPPTPYTSGKDESPLAGGVVVAALSHCVFFRALACGWWSVRCRRWKPMTRRMIT